MSSKVDVVNNFLKHYCTIAEHPTLVGAEILSLNQNVIHILSKWQQRNIGKGEITKFHKYHTVTQPSYENVFQSMPFDMSKQVLSKLSSSGKYLGTVKETVQDNKKKQFIEIWSHERLYKTFDIAAFDMHGNIYSDGEFGAFQWSPNEDKLIYIAEKKPMKTEPFYKQKSKEEAGDKEQQKSSGSTICVGDEHLYKPDWGEQLVDKHQPVIGLCNLQQESIQVVEGIPSHYSPGQVIWSNDGNSIYGVVVENEPRRLGLIYCTNRLSYVFCLTLNGSFTILSDKNKAVRSPRMSLDGNSLFWLERPAGGVHNGCYELIKFNLTTHTKEILINTVRKGNDNFSGLFLHDLPNRCFSKDGNKLFFSSLNQTRLVSYYFDLGTRTLCNLDTGELEGSSTVLDVYDDLILISVESFKNPTSLKMSNLSSKSEWVSITKSEGVIKLGVVNELMFNHDSDHEHMYYNALYYGPPPPSDSEKLVPLIVIPHGGPHSARYNAFAFDFNFFVSLGYGVLTVNYRGSTGTGEDSIEFLRGNLGSTDVMDIEQAVDKILRTYSYLDKKNIFLFGGSYGGFLVSQLSAKFPDFYRAVVNINGVSDVYSMYLMSDIPDWSTCETGLEYDQRKPLTEKEINNMVAVSPLQLADKIKAPTLFLVGKKDLRVPSYQGLTMYYALKARGVRVRLNLYDDNHALGTVPVHIDSLIHAALWFHENKVADSA